MLRFIFTINVAIAAAKRATFSRQRLADTWYERYIRHYVRLSLMRPNSFFMLTGPNRTSRLLPSGPNLLVTTGVIKWNQSCEVFGPIEKSQTRLNFKHKNQSDTLANYHPDLEDNKKFKSNVAACVYFEELQRPNTVEEIEITYEDAMTKVNTDIIGALDEYIKADKESENTDNKNQVGLN
jgi:hypothetical protein